MTATVNSPTTGPFAPSILGLEEPALFGGFGNTTAQNAAAEVYEYFGDSRETLRGLLFRITPGAAAWFANEGLRLRPDRATALTYVHEIFSGKKSAPVEREGSVSAEYYRSLAGLARHPSLTVGWGQTNPKEQFDPETMPNGAAWDELDFVFMSFAGIPHLAGESMAWFAWAASRVRKDGLLYCFFPAKHQVSGCMTRERGEAGDQVDCFGWLNNERVVYDMSDLKRMHGQAVRNGLTFRGDIVEASLTERIATAGFYQELGNAIAPLTVEPPELRACLLGDLPHGFLLRTVKSRRL